ncbi:tape measure protein [Saccharopolyspora phatthalungensis]|uniref:Tape measure domain-containing protein n=1 Tax=Saccharopolyspora phatthalungensis TaxID=664693 RepID=A0A840PXE2_9PSEU|nr:tape measure protein [Saccharopolyspora phatthalungensis]MBB5154952.1 tape measure domain-containing protein [Saccharopolyspora phatthalungensis]
MAYSAGAAYVQLLPSLRGFGSSAASQINSQLSGVGGPAGQQIGRNVGGGMETGLSATLTRLRGRFDALARDGSASMGTLARGTAPVLDQLARVSPVLGRVRDGFNDGRVAATAFSGAAGTAGGRLRAVVDHTGRVGAGFGAMATLSEGAMTRTGGAIGRGLLAPIRSANNLLASYGITAGTVFGLAGVAAAGMGIKFAASQEQAQMAFTTMLGGAQEAQRFVAELQDFAARTPFDLPSVTTGAQRLMAFGFAAQDVLPTLTAIGDAVSGMGGSAEQINQVVLAIGQMSAKGKVQGDEILQLTEAGIPALRILANQFGVTTGELQDMITKGLVPSAEAIPKLMSGIQQGTQGAAGQTQAFAGMMANQATTLTGIWSNFTDNLNKALGQLVTPALPLIKTSLGFLTDALDQVPALLQSIANSPLFQLVTGALKTAFAEISGGVRAFFAAWREGGTDLTSSGVAGFLEAVGLAARNVWDALQPVVSLLGQIAGAAIVGGWRLLGDVLGGYVAPALITVSTWVRPLTPVIVGLAIAFATWYGIAAAVAAVTGAVTLVRNAIMAVRIAWLALSLVFAASPIDFIIALVAGLVAGVIYAWTHFEGFRAVVLACWQAIQDAALWAWNNAIKPAFDGIVAGALAVGSAAVWLWQNAIVPAFNGVVTAVEAVGAAAVWLWRSAVAAFNAVAAAAAWLWFNVLSPVFSFIWLAVRVLAAIVFTVLVTPWVIAFQALAAVAMWLWDNALGPFFSWVGEQAAALWNAWVQPAIDGIVAGFRLLGASAIALWTDWIKPAIDWIISGFRWLGAEASALWTDKIVPAFDAIGQAFVWLYDHTIGFVANLIVSAFRAIGDWAVWLWTQQIVPTWTAISTAISDAYHGTIAVVFGLLRWALRAWRFLHLGLRGADQASLGRRGVGDPVGLRPLDSSGVRGGQVGGSFRGRSLRRGRCLDRQGLGSGQGHRGRAGQLRDRLGL